MQMPTQYGIPAISSLVAVYPKYHISNAIFCEIRIALQASWQKTEKHDLLGLQVEVFLLASCQTRTLKLSGIASPAAFYSCHDGSFEHNSHAILGKCIDPDICHGLRNCILCSKELHLANALCPICVTESGMMMLSKELHPSNAMS